MHRNWRKILVFILVTIVIVAIVVLGVTTLFVPLWVKKTAPRDLNSYQPQPSSLAQDKHSQGINIDIPSQSKSTASRTAVPTPSQASTPETQTNTPSSSQTPTESPNPANQDSSGDPFTHGSYDQQNGAYKV